MHVCYCKIKLIVLSLYVYIATRFKSLKYTYRHDCYPKVLNTIWDTICDKMIFVE